MASRIVRSRAGASCGPPVSRGRRRSRRASRAGGGSTATRAAASSMASGKPSRWRQMAATTGPFASVRANPARTARARATNSATAGAPARSAGEVAPAAGSARGGTGSRCSPWSRSGARLAASTCNPGQAARRSPICAVAGSTCSQLSRTSRSRSGRRYAASATGSERSLLSRTPSACPMADSTNAGSRTGARSTTHTPSGKLPDPAASPAAASASRVLPTPPGPVRVSSGAASSSRNARAASSSAARPMSRVRGWGRVVPERPVAVSIIRAR